MVEDSFGGCLESPRVARTVKLGWRSEPRTSEHRRRTGRYVEERRRGGARDPPQIRRRSSGGFPITLFGTSGRFPSRQPALQELAAKLRISRFSNSESPGEQHAMPSDLTP